MAEDCVPLPRCSWNFFTVRQSWLTGDLFPDSRVVAGERYVTRSIFFQTGVIDMTKVGQGLSAAAARVAFIGALLSTVNSAYGAAMIWAGDFEEGGSSIDDSRDADFHKHLYNEGTAAAADVRSAGGMGLCDRPREGSYAGRTRILAGGSGKQVRAEIKANAPGVISF